MVALNSDLLKVTARIVRRSRASRAAYLARIEAAAQTGTSRQGLACGNLAHGFAACPADDKSALRAGSKPNLAIISAYNDMLSAHQPLETYPEMIKQAAREVGGVAQFAGGVPAMCDGVTQGRAGMELSLFSRDTIAMATAIALSHDMFDAGLCLGVCDKIVPGLLMGALRFGHLPFIFVPAGPMPSGISNDEKSRVRKLFAAGKIGRDELLNAEASSYHAPGTCTFYGTANTNQLLMEFMGVHLPGASFIPPNTDLRDAFTRAAAKRVLQLTHAGAEYLPLAKVIDEKAIVNGIVGLLASGGSTNHTLHLVAIAAAAGIRMDWEDISKLSAVVPLLARVYPNGSADVNHFQAAGGVAILIRELRAAGLLHDEVKTVAGAQGLAAYQQTPVLRKGELVWIDGPEQSSNFSVVASIGAPFDREGGLRLLTGNLGRAVIKTSAVKPEHRFVEAPAVVFEDQDALLQAFKRGELERDFIAVIRFQGPRANGMPELHKLTPTLTLLQDKGFKVALVTDGRMSGASGRVPAAIHLTPEALGRGPLAKVRDGDIIRLDAEKGELLLVDPSGEWLKRTASILDPQKNEQGCGRELFSAFRSAVNGAESGATLFRF